MVWHGFFPIQKSWGPMTCIAQGVVSHSNGISPHSSLRLQCLLTSVCTTVCAQAVPRQALAPVQRPEVEQANRSGNAGQFTKTEHEIEVKCAVCRCFT